MITTHATHVVPRRTATVSVKAWALGLALMTLASGVHAQDGMMKDKMASHAGGMSSLNRDAAGIAVGGYDVVAYQAQNAAVAGTAAFVATHHGATFRFATAANRDAFVAQPDRYLPQYDGYCAMGVAVGRKFDVDPTAFRVVDGKLYLNKDAATQRMWLRDVPGNIAKANAQWPSVSKRAVDR